MCNQVTENEHTILQDLCILKPSLFLQVVHIVQCISSSFSHLVRVFEVNRADPYTLHQLSSIQYWLYCITQMQFTVDSR